MGTQLIFKKCLGAWVLKYLSQKENLLFFKNLSTYALTHLRTDQNGIALLLVLGSIVILTMIGVEFSYNAQVEYHLAIRQKERLQAYYLANSAYNLIRLELKIGNQVQSQIQSATSQAGLQLPMDLSAPLCQQFPMKTTLFRLVMAASSEQEAEKEPSETAQTALEALPLQGVEEFLQFEGDFEGECIDEASKIDLNFFYAQDPSKKIDGRDNAYDEYKKFVIGLLAQPAYQDLFKDSEVKVTEVVRNIADWIDPNENINEFGGLEGGGEDSVYRGGVSGQSFVKNGKLSLMEDIYQVWGVEDKWWIPVSDIFTIYGVTSTQGKPQVNVCRAPNEVVRTLILRYTETRADLPPLKTEDEEILSQLVATVKEGCTGATPDKNKIAQDLDMKLQELLKARPITPTTLQGGGYGTQASSFADWVATQSRFFKLKLLGQVQDTVVKINAVVDLGQGNTADTTKWKTVYYKIE